jgi:hypothetical protein
MTTEQIYLSILAKPNCSCETAVGFIQDLHGYAKITVSEISKIKDPRESQKALMLKAQLLGLLEGYDKLRRGVPNAKRRR